jgi:hypothetical protein
MQTATPVGSQDGEASSEPVNQNRADLNHYRKDSVQPISSFRNGKTKKDLAQFWRQPWRVDGHSQSSRMPAEVQWICRLHQ